MKRLRANIRRRLRERTRRRVKLVFKDPITFDVLEAACACVGAYKDLSDGGRTFVPISPDDVLFQLPHKALEGKIIPLDRQQAFLDAVLERPIDLSRMSIEERDALVTYAAAGEKGFFFTLFLTRAKRQIDDLLRYMREAGYPPRRVRA